MQRLATLLLVFGFLLSQLGLITHSYEQHDSGELCEICMVANHLDHGLAPTVTMLHSAVTFTPFNKVSPHVYQPQPLQVFAARAPPRFL